MVETERNEVFISYSHKDKGWLEKIQTHLKPLVRRDIITIWDDTKITAGTKWENEIYEAISRAKIAILLVSPNFLASDFIAKNELPPLLETAEKNGLSIVWIPISFSSYTETEINKYQAAHNPSHPLASLPEVDQDKALVDIVKQIKAIIEIPSQKQSVVEDTSKMPIHSVALELALSQEQPVWLPLLSTNTIFYLTKQSESALILKVKLKLWIASERVSYSGGGLYDGTKNWELTGSFRGVINPGPELTNALHFKTRLDIPQFLDLEHKKIFEKYQELDIDERIRARLFAFYQDPDKGNKKETKSMMYYLESKQVFTKNEHGHPIKLQGFLWIPTPSYDKYPPDSHDFEG